MVRMMDRVLSRRNLVGLAGLSATGLGVSKVLASQSQPPMEGRGDWESYPAAPMLMAFATANFPQLPYSSMEELQPGPGWQLMNSVELGSFMIPPGWSGVLGWANSLRNDGVPEWQPQQLTWPFWAATAAVSPDETSSYAHINGSVDAFLAPDDGIELARTTVLGNKVRGKEVCAALQSEMRNGIENIHWIAAHLYPDGLLLSRGWAILSEVSGASLGPGSTFGFDAMFSPADVSTPMMKDVFIPIMWQHVPKGGGGTDPTPTPTP